VVAAFAAKDAGMSGVTIAPDHDRLVRPLATVTSRSLCPTELDAYVLAFAKAGFLQALMERSSVISAINSLVVI